ncbi:MAG: lycopene cyclase domain-containing protein [Candidatus Binatia bacterium]
MLYNFLILSLLFLLPGAIVFAARADLRRVIGIMALCSIPFAFTESLFYPSYWEPKFLFDLADRIGFGIEDVLFVVGLSAFTSTAYAFFSGARYERLGALSLQKTLASGATVLAVTFALVAFVALLGVPMIYGSFWIMLGVTGFLCLRRPDLLWPSLLGGLWSALVYSLLCVIFGWLIPEVFQLTWKTEQFLNLFILGIPLEEIMYGFAAGVAATAFYPYVWRQRFKAHD